MAKNADGKRLPTDGSPLDWVRQGVFPDDWTLIPVQGKRPHVKEWPDHKRSRIDAEGLYLSDSRSSGFGVVTGALSGGLIALDIDGHQADSRYRAAVGEAYEAFGEEQTMSWTSGKPGRRQILYRVPEYMVELLAHVNSVILQLSGEWELGSGDVDRQKEGEDEKYEEVVLRFNRCQSVLPQSRHPDTREPYRFLQYHGGQPAEAPEWMLDVLRWFRKAQPWLSDAARKQLDEHADHGNTLLPERQIRGWFFGETVQALLQPRLEDLVFRHRTFEEYGWKTRAGKNPQRMSGCPWHGGESGTAFQYSVLSGCWDCKACGVGGDVLDFIHKVESGDKHAGKPRGNDLENYVARIAGELGLKYPEDANVQVTKEAPRVEMDEVDFHKELCRIHDEESNPAIRLGKMAGLAQSTGRRLTGSQCLAAMDEFRYYEDAHHKNRKVKWWQEVERMSFTIPNVLKVPSQTVLHSQPGEGKTSACMGLAKIIGRGLPMRVRGIQVPVRKGNVLWIQNDQSPAKLLQDCEDNGIDPATDTWLIVKRGFQLNHIKEMTEWIREHKPALVVVDSISSCSTKMQISEIEKAFASPFYYLSERNGDPGDEGFPATSIIWIHHDNASGNVRGTRLLVAAMDEQWHLRKLKDEERDNIREKRLVPTSCRFIEIKKSRMGREGDRLIVHRDENFSYSVWDFTPTEKREDNGQGDPDPNTTCLKVVKEHVLKERGRPGGDDRMTAQEVWESLAELVSGQGRKAPSSKTVKRWLDRWTEAGLLVFGRKKRVAGVKQLVGTYTLPPQPRVVGDRECLLSFYSSKPLQELEKTMDSGEAPEDVVRCSDQAPARPQNSGQAVEPETDVRCSIPVTASDFGEPGTKDTSSHSPIGGEHLESDWTTPQHLTAHDLQEDSDQPAALSPAGPVEGLPGLEATDSDNEPGDRGGSLEGDGGGAAMGVAPGAADEADGVMSSDEPSSWDDFDSAFDLS